MVENKLMTRIDAVWAGYWGIFYRKFFWDFVSGIQRNPGGFQYVYTRYHLSLLLIIALDPQREINFLWTLLSKYPFCRYSPCCLEQLSWHWNTPFLWLRNSLFTGPSSFVPSFSSCCPLTTSSSIRCVHFALTKYIEKS